MFDVKTDFAGKDGFVWWFGRVADASVWKDINAAMSQNGSYGQRCKVRIIGYHPWGNELPEEDLPWAAIMMDSVSGSGQGGMGDVVSLVGGESCIGFFMDGEEAQQPVIIGLINRHNGIKNSISENDILDGKPIGYNTISGGNLGNATKAPKVEKNPIGKNSPVVQGSVKNPAADYLRGQNNAFADGVDNDGLNSNFAEAIGAAALEQGVVTNKGGGSNAADVTERDATGVHVNPSNCKNDSIGQITQVLTDFIALTNSLESALGKFVDPIANLIYDMDAELRRVVRQVMGLIKGVLNDIRDGIIGKLNFLFSKFLGTLNLVNPFEFLSDEASRLAYQKVLDVIFCIFEKLLGDLGDFLLNMFNTLIGNVVSGPICAAEQFVSGIFAKVFEKLEEFLEPVLAGLDWLVGGIGVISEFIGKATNLAQQIINFIGCDGRKCTTPSKWVSTLSGSIITSADNWDRQLKNINILKGVSADLTKIGDAASKGIGAFFGSDEFNQSNYNGMQLSSILSATDKLTGGNSAGALNGALGSIESAITTTSLFGTSSIFNSCTQSVNNPKRQRDLMPMPLGFAFANCLAPEIEISGKGSGATATPIVNQFGKIIATQITSRGSGYDSKTAASVIDNTNKGSNAELKVLVKDGEISQIVVIKSGFGFCPNVSPITPNPVGIITAIYVEKPGIGYTIGDSILIPLPRIINDTPGDGTVSGPGFPTPTDGIVVIDAPPEDLTGIVLDPDSTQPGIIPDGDNPSYIVAPIPTPGNGSIVDVRIPVNMNAEYNFIPNIRINSRTGVGAKLIPILTYKQLDNVDTSGVERSGLVGITSVIDCI